MKVAALLGGLLITGGLAVAGFAATASSDSGAVAQQAPRGNALEERRAAGVERYAVLKKPAATGSAAEAALAKARGATVAGLGLRAEDVSGVAAAVAHEDEDVRVVVSGIGKGGVCLGVRETHGSGSFGCTDTAYAGDAVKPLAAVDAIGGDRWRVTVLLVDGIGSVAIETAERTRELTVAGNVATAVVPAGPFTLRWTPPDGSAQALRATAG